MRARPTRSGRSRLPGRPQVARVVLASVLVLSACSSATDPDPAHPPDPATSPSATATSGRYPDASSTGVPEGTTLTASESLEITQDGTVVEGLDVHGRVIIAANDVVLRNTRVRTDTSTYPIHVTDGATGVLIEDVEVDNMGGTGIGILISSDSSATIRRADVHSAEDGIRIQGDEVVIEDSYVHDLQRQEGGHHDAIQIRSGDDITLRGNTLLPFVESTADPMNAALQIGSLLGDDQVSRLRVIDNYMNGGNYTINGGGDDVVDSAVYSGNRFGRDFRYGVAGNLGATSSWDESNVWDDNGEPAS